MLQAPDVEKDVQAERKFPEGFEEALKAGECPNGHGKLMMSGQNCHCQICHFNQFKIPLFFK